MALVNEELRYPSSNGRDTIAAQLWYDDAAQPLGIVQIIHGMDEYMGRYESFARFLVSNGYAVCGNDHAGHGKSAGADGYGYFADKHGDRVLVEDVHTLNGLIMRRFTGLKAVLLGHSMGSFICRSYITRYTDGLAGVILSGTAGPNPLVGFGLFLSRMIMLFKGAKYTSPLLNKLAFGHYCDRYDEKRTKYDWLSRDSAVVDRYAADEMCTFPFTAGAYHDMLRLMKAISSRKWAGRLPKELPYLIFSGSMDPVGDYAKGVNIVYARMKEAGLKDITYKIYKGGRHEMLNDIERATVYGDVLAWLARVTAGRYGAPVKV